MSVGNLNTYGDKKQNTTWQLSMLQQMKLVEDAVTNAFPAAVVRTPSLLRTSAAGTVAAGARSVSVYNAGGANGTVLGVVIKPGEQLSWEAGSLGDTLSAITYSGVGTELVIAKVV